VRRRTGNSSARGRLGIDAAPVEANRRASTASAGAAGVPPRQFFFVSISDPLTGEVCGACIKPLIHLLRRGYPMKRVFSGLLAMLAAVAMTIGVSAPANADGSTYIYKCVSITDGTYTIPFSQIFSCSNGPYDVTFVDKVSTYSGDTVAWIDGECAFYAYYVKGWRDMSTIWSHCLTHHDIPS
jgi:hypothetical protein